MVRTAREWTGWERRLRSGFSPEGRGGARLERHGKDLKDGAGRGVGKAGGVRHRSGCARLGTARAGKAGAARRGEDRNGADEHGPAGMVSRHQAWTATDRPGGSRRGGTGGAWQRPGTDRYGTERNGESRLATHGQVSRDEHWKAAAGAAGLGGVGRGRVQSGTARLGRAGKVGVGMDSRALDRQGQARRARERFCGMRIGLDWWGTVRRARHGEVTIAQEQVRNGNAIYGEMK